MSQYTLKAAMGGPQTNSGTASSLPTPTQVANSVTKSLTPSGGAVTSSGTLSTTGQAVNPKDLPGYVPGSSPTDKIDTSQPSPQTAQATPTTGASANAQTNTAQGTDKTTTPSGIPGMPDLTGTAQERATQALDQLKQKYGTAFNTLNNSGVDASKLSQGSANAGVQAALNSQPQPQQQQETPPPVQSFFDPTSDVIQNQMQSMLDIVSPPAERQALTDAITQLKTDRGELSGLKTELMNVKNIMAGTQQDIADEVTKAGGTITQSLLANMTIARNRALLQQQTQLEEQIQSQQDAVNTDTTLVGDMKDMANTEYTQRMAVMNYLQTNYNNQLNAARDSIKTLLGPNMENAANVYAAVKGTPYEARYEQILGLPSGGMAQLATIANTTAEKNALEIQGLKLDNAKKTAELNGTGNVDSASVAAWAQNIKAGTAKLSDITGNPSLKNAVSQALAAGGTPQGDILKTTASSLKELQDMVDKNQGFEAAVGLPDVLAHPINFVQALFTGKQGTQLAGTSGADFDLKLNQVTNDIVLPNLNLLHGLGRVTDREFQALKSAVTSLNPNMSEDEFKTELKTITDRINEKMGISVTAPDGSIHNFPDQASADSFKKAAGIQ